MKKQHSRRDFLKKSVITSGGLGLLLPVSCTIWQQNNIDQSKIFEKTKSPDNLVIIIDCLDTNDIISLTSDKNRIIQCLFTHKINQSMIRCLLQKSVCRQITVKCLQSQQLPYINNLINRLVVYSYKNMPAKGIQPDEIIRILAIDMIKRYLSIDIFSMADS